MSARRRLNLAASLHTESSPTDFHDVDLSALWIPATFLRVAKKAITDPAQVATMMGRYVVTISDILTACVRNDCKSAMPIQYAARYVDNFDVPDFLEELVEVILDQPYRGAMLQ